MRKVLFEFASSIVSSGLGIQPQPDKNQLYTTMKRSKWLANVYVLLSDAFFGRYEGQYCVLSDVQWQGASDNEHYSHFARLNLPASLVLQKLALLSSSVLCVLKKTGIRDICISVVS